MGDRIDHGFTFARPQPYSPHEIANGSGKPLAVMEIDCVARKNATPFSSPVEQHLTDR